MTLTSLFLRLFILDEVPAPLAESATLPRISFSRGAHEAGTWGSGPSGPPIIYSIVKSRAASWLSLRKEHYKNTTRRSSVTAATFWTDPIE